MSLIHIEKAKLWLTDEFDEQTQKEVSRLLEEKGKELEEAFYKNLEFGTGGLRGIMGVGTNRINRYTIGMATQGFANYLKDSFAHKEELAVAISYDNRHNSKLFATITAEVFSANNFKVYLFDSLRPTPELSFAIRFLKCVGGVMITASHNPKEYNGYKVYWEDGAQVTAPHDNNIIGYVNAISTPSMVNYNAKSSNITLVGKELDRAYLDAIMTLTLNDQIKEEGSDLSIVYTPLHGTGVRIIPEALKRAGFSKIFSVAEQEINDGDFPTVDSPNPEEHGALEMAIERALELNAELVMATDPDSDRLGVAARNKKGELELLNGNQIASILIYYILETLDKKGKIKRGVDGDYVIKTIVTTDLIKAICDGYNVELFNVLTGFKHIASLIKSLEGKRRFIAGGEESYGFNAGEFVRDKDAVISCCLMAEATEWAKSRGLNLFSLMDEIYSKFGLYKEGLLSLTKKGKEGLQEINQLMERYRTTPPESIDGSQVLLIHDYLLQESYDIVSDLRYKISLPKSNVLQFITADNTVVSVRPSGTEPKIKFYFGVKESNIKIEEMAEANERAIQKLERITKLFENV